MNAKIPDILFGVDGGGTGCRAAIATRDLTILAQAEGGPANVFSNFEGAIANINSVLRQVFAKASLSDSGLKTARGHLGLAGVISEDIALRVCAALAMDNISVSDDRPTALAGALAGHDGFLAAIGTGSFVGRSVSGRAEFVGGWGFQVSDQASGAWLGRKCLAETLLCVDKLSPHTPLSQEILTRFDGHPNAIVSFAQRATPADFASLVPCILRHFKSGDALAQRLLEEGRSYILNSLNRLGFTAGDRLYFSGGLGEAYANMMPQDMAAGLKKPQDSNLMGALRLALLQSGMRDQ